ncbi:MAG: hypothetical protein M0042_15590 [Nitrospiraceae bacterium]|nr:hypothetical protein [Nitrospiraceae bacterium]
MIKVNRYGGQKDGPRTGRTILFSALFLVLAGALILGYMKYVAFPNPENCKSCHYIAPYYKKWKSSTHSKVPCLKCHVYTAEKALAAQLLFLAGSFNPRPISNVPDANCLQQGCHDKRLVESNVLYTRWSISFDHKPHFSEMKRGIKLHCRSCHSDIVQGDHVKVSKHVCFLCHFKGAEPGEAVTGCPSCHGAPNNAVMVRGKPFSHTAALRSKKPCASCHLAVTRGEGVTPKDRCFFCHVDRSEKYNDVKMLHEKHVGAKQIDCLWCHERIEHGTVRMLER